MKCAAIFTIVSKIITTKINHYKKLITTHYSLLINHYSLLINHYSLQSYYSLFNPVYADDGKIAEKGYP